MTRHYWATLVPVFCFFCSATLPARAQTTYRNMSSVHDGSGLLSTSTVEIEGRDYRHVSAAGQPGGIFSSAAGTMNNHAGFLQAVDIKKPGLDTDGDGVIDEISLDNDGDGLEDLAEILGSGFNPATPTEVNVADSDGDGIPDGDESIAGTNPRDASSLLEIVSVKPDGSGQVVSWSARGDGTVAYRLMYEHAKSTGAPPNAIEIGPVAGGLPPWFETDGIFTNIEASGTAIYAIEASPAP